MNEEFNEALLNTTSNREKRQVETMFATKKATMEHETKLPDVNDIKHQTLSDIIEKTGNTKFFFNK